MLARRIKMIKVVIADDSVLIRERLVGMLSELSKVEIVGQAGDAWEAIDFIQDLGPDVVILDIRMPGKSGINLIPYIKYIKQANPAPVIIMFTNYPYPQYRKKCMDAGADYFFNKSTEFEKIPELLKNLNRDFQG